MQSLAVKPYKSCIYYGGERIDYTLRPLTFARMIEITELLDGKELKDVLSDPSPFETTTIAFVLMDDESKKNIERFKLQLDDGTELSATTPEKLYHLLCETSVTEGYENLVQLTTAINMHITRCLPVETKKKTILTRLASMPLKMLRRSTTL